MILIDSERLKGIPGEARRSIENELSVVVKGVSCLEAGVRLGIESQPVW